MMKAMKKMILMALMMCSATLTYAEETQATNECDTTYIKLDANLEPINYVNLTYDELAAKVGELETILETDDFQLSTASASGMFFATHSLLR